MKCSSKASQPFRWLFSLSAAALLAGQGQIMAQSDDFNDGNDDGWARYDPRGGLGLGPQAQFSFPDGGYRIFTPITPPLNGGGLNPGRAGSSREGNVYTDFYIAVDLVNRDTNADQSIGILARVNTPGFMTLNCYAFTYDTSDNAPGSGDLDLSVVTGEVPSGLPTGDSNVHLDPTKDYRFVFIGRGPMLEGRVYELPNLLEPIKVITSQDSTWTQGASGLVTFDNTGGNSVTDATFDNYFASRVEPPKLFVSYNPDFDEVTVSWATTLDPFRLQSTGDLNSPITWTDIPENQIFPSGNSLQYSTSPENAFRAYRLILD